MGGSPERFEYVRRADLNARDASASSTVPAADELWARLHRFLSQWGTVDDTARGLSLTWGDRRWVTEIQMSPSELHAYVSDFVRWRIENGHDEGIDDGLPLPLMDSEPPREVRRSGLMAQPAD